MKKIPLIILSVAAFMVSFLPYSTRGDRVSSRDTIAHRILDLEAEPGERINYAALDNVILEAKTRIGIGKNASEKQALAALQAIDDILLENNFLYKSGTLLLTEALTPQKLDSKTLSSIRKFTPEMREKLCNQRRLELGQIIVSERQKRRALSRTGEDFFFADCDTFCHIYLGIADALDLPLREVRVPGHIFLRWHFSPKHYFNWDVTSASPCPDDEYIKDYRIAREDIQSGIYMKSLSRNETLALVHRNIAVRLHERGLTDRALHHAGTAVTLDARCPPAYNIRGMIWRQKGELDKALLDFNQAALLSPRSPDIFVNRGALWSNLGKQEKALEDLSRALILEPDSVDALINRGITLSRLGDQNRALDDLKRALKLRPGSARVYDNRGIIWIIKGKPQKAIDDLTRAIRIDPSHADSYINRGMAHDSLGKHKEAVTDFTSAILLDPRDPSGYYNRGNVFSSLGKSTDAIRDFTAAIERDPSDARLRSARAFEWLKLGKPGEAVRDYSLALELAPGNPNWHHNRGVAWQKLGEWKKAELDFDKEKQLKNQ